MSNESFCTNCRLQKEYELLQKFLDEEKDLNETKEYENATQIAKEAKEELSKPT